MTATATSGMTFVGLDMSLSSTGVCVVDGNGTKKVLRTIMSAPENFKNVHDRIDFIVEQVMASLPGMPNMICIEKPFINPKNIQGNADLIYLGKMIRRALIREGFPYIEIQPAHLKQFATGKGNAKKPQVMSVSDLWGFKPFDDNQADASILAVMAKNIIAVRNGFNDLNPLQMEIIHKEHEGKMYANISRLYPQWSMGQKNAKSPDTVVEYNDCPF